VATRKLADVVQRAATGRPPVNLLREIWAFGSFARGARTVGDIDLYVLVDEERSPQRYALDTYYSRARPFSEQIKALGCGGSSHVSVQAHPVFGMPGEPASPERQARLRAEEKRLEGTVQTETPVVRHVVTGEPLAGPFVLLWARGDELAWALKRLDDIPEDPDAGRHERTTSIPLLDDLGPKLGLPTAFHLAAQVRQGNLACRAMLLEPSEPPAEAQRRLEARYRNPYRQAPSVRMAAAAAALHKLASDALDLRNVRLVDGPVADDWAEPIALVDFNPFTVYSASTGQFPSGFRLLQVWPAGKAGPWLTLEVTTLNQEGARDLYHTLTDINASAVERSERLLKCLGQGAGGRPCAPGCQRGSPFPGPRR
jgi:predicted nucleotidyltransferase